MKKVFNENKTLFILAVIIIISLIVMGIGLISYFYGNNKNPYGDRLKDVDSHKISDSISSDIKSLYTEGVSDVSVEVKGKIIYIVMNVDDGVSKLDAQGYAVKALDKFESEDLEYYDVQFLITCEDEKVTDEDDKKVFPIAGARKAKNTQIVWSNN